MCICSKRASNALCCVHQKIAASNRMDNCVLNECCNVSLLRYQAASPRLNIGMEERNRTCEKGKSCLESVTSGLGCKSFPFLRCSFLHPSASFFCYREQKALARKLVEKSIGKTNIIRAFLSVNTGTSFSKKHGRNLKRWSNSTLLSHRIDF